MKIIKQIVLVMVLATFASCGPTKVVKQSKKTLKGYWSLDNVSYDRTGIFDVVLFEDVKSECLVGSTWRFIPNNNFGNYEITVPGCEAGKRYFVWGIPNNDGTDTNYDILLKPTDEKMNSTMNNQGFRVNLAYLSDEQLTMTQTINFEGKPFKIIMNFSRTAE